MYLGFPKAAGEPPKQLKGWKRVQVPLGGQTRVHIPFTEHTFRVWDSVKHEWTVVKGTYTIYIGRSSRDIRLKQTFVLG